MRGEPTSTVRIEPCFVCGVPVAHHTSGDAEGCPRSHAAPCGSPCIGGVDLSFASANEFVEKARAYHCANGCPAVGCLGGGRYAAAGGARG